MVLLDNEVGGNFDMNGDVHIGRDKFLCKKGCIAQRQATIKSKHFTVIGIKKLLGENICCILIIEGKE